MKHRILKFWFLLNTIINNKNFYINYCKKKLYINANNSLLNQLLHSKDGYYESSLVESIIKEIEFNDKQNLFIDIGANVGFISTYVNHLYNQVSIAAFEPGPKQYHYFSKTIHKNNLSSIHLENIALSNTKGIAKFYTHSLEHNSGDGFLDTGRAGEGTEISVSTEKLDDYIKTKFQDKNIKVIKIDTEGSELLVLEGALETIKHHRPVIFIEIWEENLKDYPYTVDDIFNFFANINYQLFTLNDIEVKKDNYHLYKNKESMYKAKYK